MPPWLFQSFRFPVYTHVRSCLRIVVVLHLFHPPCHFSSFQGVLLWKCYLPILIHETHCQPCATRIWWETNPGNLLVTILLAMIMILDGGTIGDPKRGWHKTGPQDWKLGQTPFVPFALRKPTPHSAMAWWWRRILNHALHNVCGSITFSSCTDNTVIALSRWGW